MLSCNHVIMQGDFNAHIYMTNKTGLFFFAEEAVWENASKLPGVLVALATSRSLAPVATQPLETQQSL